MAAIRHLLMLAAATVLAPAAASASAVPAADPPPPAYESATRQPLNPAEFVAAARMGDENAIRKSLELDPGLLNSRDALGLTALDWAATREHWPIFRQLLAAGADCTIVGFDGGTALHRLAHHDQPEFVRLLLAAGADPNFQNQWGRTSLHVAARRGQVEVAKVLLDAGADPRLGTREGWTPLHVAYRSGQPEMVVWLIAAGADRAAQDRDGKVPSDHLFQRPPAWQGASPDLWSYQGHYRVGDDFYFTVRVVDGVLTLEHFSVVELYPTGPDAFYTMREPWPVEFSRNPAGRVTGITVRFLRRAETGTRVEHPEYVGSRVCAQCHVAGDDGAPYATWLRSGHSAAFWRLKTDWASFLAAQRPHLRDLTDPAAERRCRNCHTTAALDESALFAASFRREEGVGCEACHGPGSKYANRETMTDHEAFLAAGGRIPDAGTCRSCHRNPDNFSFDEWWPRIVHGGTHPGAASP